MKCYKSIFYLILIFSSITLAKKTDIVIMNNGITVIGEIKKLEFGKLTFKTDDMGTMNIKWNKVKHLISKHVFEIIVEDGGLYFGSLDSSSVEGRIIITRESDSVHTFRMDIVGIVPIKSSFWDRNSGSVSVGLNYTKATRNGQLKLMLDNTFRSEKWISNSMLNSIFSFQDNEQTSKNQNLSISLERTLPNYWLAGATLAFEQNTELGIQLRSSITPMGGYIFTQSNKNVLWGVAGLSFNKEDFTDTTQSVFNLDGYFQLQYKLFIYDDPEINLNTFVNVFPGLTDWGRVRANFYVSLDWEIFNDFYWNLTFNLNYDNKPTGNASTNDYNFNSALKYKFN
jgi:hypothetical protein